jgi:hypothetical protein
MFRERVEEMTQVCNCDSYVTYLHGQLISEDVLMIFISTESSKGLGEYLSATKEMILLGDQFVFCRVFKRLLRCDNKRCHVYLVPLVQLRYIMLK